MGYMYTYIYIIHIFSHIENRFNDYFFSWVLLFIIGAHNRAIIYALKNAEICTKNTKIYKKILHISNIIKKIVELFRSKKKS